MKRKLVLLIMVLAAAFMITACGQESGENGSEGTEAGSKAFDPAQVKTLGDLFAYENDGEHQEGFSEEKYVYVLEQDGVYYRAAVDLPEDVSEALWAIEFDDEDRDQKVRDLVSPLEIKNLENLNEQIPSQEELDKLVGKTGQDLFDDGWSQSGYDLEEMQAWMNHGPFAYVVKFEYDGEPMVNTDDFDFEKEFKDLKVKSVEYDGIGDAANPE